MISQTALIVINYSGMLFVPHQHQTLKASFFNILEACVNITQETVFYSICAINQQVLEALKSSAVCESSSKDFLSANINNIMVGKLKKLGICIF